MQVKLNACEMLHKGGKEKGPEIEWVGGAQFVTGFYVKH